MHCVLVNLMRNIRCLHAWSNGKVAEKLRAVMQSNPLKSRAHLRSTCKSKADDDIVEILCWTQGSKSSLVAHI